MKRYCISYKNDSRNTRHMYPKLKKRELIQFKIVGFVVIGSLDWLSLVIQNQVILPFVIFFPLSSLHNTYFNKILNDQFDNNRADEQIFSKRQIHTEVHLRHPRFKYSPCGPSTKNKERIQKFKDTGDSKYIYQNEVCFQHVMAY